MTRSGFARIARAFGAVVLGMVMSASAASAGKTLRVANDGDLGTLDPQLNGTAAEDRALLDVSMGLLVAGPDGTRQPGAAESWTISSDGLVYTFKIRPHLWSDGVPVTADDFVFSFRRALLPETAAQYASLFFTIRNGQAVNKGEVAPESLGVKALDSSTLEVTLEYPAPYFLDQLMHGVMAPVPRHVVEKWGKDWSRPDHHVGNGPFTLESYRPNDQLVLVRNPLFYDAVSVKIDKVIFYAMEDFDEQVKRFRAGEVDIVTKISPDQLERVQNLFPQEIRITQTLGIVYYGFNVTRPPFDDVRVRQALSMAIDRDVLSRNVMRNGEVPAYSYAPPGIAGYDPGNVEWKDWPMDRRVSEAKKLLAEAGVGPEKPLKFQLRFSTSDSAKRRAVAIAAMWKQLLGVEAELLNAELKIHYAELTEMNFDVGHASWGGDYADPQNFLYSHKTYSRRVRNYSNPEFDALMDDSDRIIDPVARFDILRQAETVLMRDQPVIPVAYTVSTFLVSQKVSGWEDNVLGRHSVRWMDIANG